MSKKSTILVVGAFVFFSAVIFGLSWSPTPVEINVSGSGSSYSGWGDEEITGSLGAKVEIKLVQKDPYVSQFDFCDWGAGTIEDGYFTLSNNNEVGTVTLDSWGKADIRIVAYTSIQNTASYFAWREYPDESWTNFGITTE